MKYVRKPPEPPKAEPMPAPAHVPQAVALDTSEMVAAVRALHAAADRMAAPHVQVTVPAPKIAKPSAFTVRITKRDSKGRTLEFDVHVKNEAATGQEDDLEAGFNEATRQ